MQESALTTIGLPLALAFIMFGLGLHLTTADFRRVWQQPKAALVALMCQMLILPLLCLALCKALALPPELAVGMMLLAASPGGTTANLYSYLFKGDVALNISLTALNSIFAIITIPIITNFALQTFMGDGMYIPLQLKKVLEVVAIVLIPVGIGMFVRSRAAGFAARMDKVVKIASAVILLLLVVSILLKERDNLAGFFASAGLATLLFNILSLGVGYFVPKFFGLGQAQRIASAMEIGIHNGTLAIYLALTVLQNSAMSVPPAIYSLIMFFTAAIFGWMVSRRSA